MMVLKRRILPVRLEVHCPRVPGLLGWRTQRKAKEVASRAAGSQGPGV